MSGWLMWRKNKADLSGRWRWRQRVDVSYQNPGSNTQCTSLSINMLIHNVPLRQKIYIDTPLAEKNYIRHVWVTPLAAGLSSRRAYFRVNKWILRSRAVRSPCKCCPNSLKPKSSQSHTESYDFWIARLVAIWAVMFAMVYSKRWHTVYVFEWW